MAVVMTLQDIITEYRKHLTKDKLAKLLGVTPHQIYLYGIGQTKEPRSDVVDKIYDNLRHDGEKVVLDFYSDEKEYLMYRGLS